MEIGKIGYSNEFFFMAMVTLDMIIYLYCLLCNTCVWYSLQNVEYLILDLFFDNNNSMNYLHQRTGKVQ